MSKLRLAFGKLIINSHGEELDLVEHTYKALENTELHTFSKTSNTIVSFLDVDIKEHLKRKYLIGFYGYAGGEKYKIIDPANKTISQQKYPIPPFINESMFVLTENGDLIFEEKDISYIEPEKIANELEIAYRKYAVEWPVKIRMMELSDDTATMVEFIYSLRKLFTIEFSNLRHSNPSQQSMLLDELTVANIDTLKESSSHSEGIDRDNEEFKNQIAHIENSYGKIKKAEGHDAEGFSAMELKDENLRLTVTIKDQNVETKLKKMIAMLNELANKLSFK